jgi:uncharacterized protein (DUF362 family)
MDVFLARADAYADAEPVVFQLLDSLNLSLPASGYVLVKPNLISSRNARLSCTHPAIVAATARYFLDRNCSVVVGDSPAFGSARSVGRASGLTRLLDELGLDLVTLAHPVPITFGPFTVGISTTALNAALIVNLPKLKAHSQMRVSGGVKNLFGTVSGFRKPLVHFRHGDRQGRFAAFFVHLMQALPETISLMDGITAMHETGPTFGKPFAGRMLGASRDTVALDTAVYGLLGLKPADVPIWRECVCLGIEGAFPEMAHYPLDVPNAFHFEGFAVPGELQPEVFGPRRLVRSLIKRLLR